MTELPDALPAALCRILALDGGGAKGFYTLGVLNDIEAMIDRPLVERFDVIFGTSTGAIIAALIALGRSITDIRALYREHVPRILAAKTPAAKSRALQETGQEVFGDQKFEGLPTHLGIVAARWHFETPMIFKTSIAQAHGSKGTFVPGFGCTLSDAVQASCSAYPFFRKKVITTSLDEKIELIDGGYCANNPTLYALADALTGLRRPPETVRILSVGVGDFPPPTKAGLKRLIEKGKLWTAGTLGLDVQLLDKTIHINTQSMDTLRHILFEDIPTIRINDAFTQPELATDFLEHNQKKLDMLYQRGRQSFAKYEAQLRGFLM
jgi:uncharacterized protein